MWEFSPKILHFYLAAEIKKSFQLVALEWFPLRPPRLTRTHSIRSVYIWGASQNRKSRQQRVTARVHSLQHTGRLGPSLAVWVREESVLLRGMQRAMQCRGHQTRKDARGVHYSLRPAQRTRFAHTKRTETGKMHRLLHGDAERPASGQDLNSIMCAES